MCYDREAKASSVIRRGECLMESTADVTTPSFRIYLLYLIVIFYPNTHTDYTQGKR